MGVKRAPRRRTQSSAPPASRTLRLTVQYATTSSTVPDEARFRKWVRAALRSDAQITVRLVGLKEARELNRTYRGKDYATNVLTFVMRDRPPYEGDLALCAPVVAREAREQGKELTAHYAHLTVHGVLHLQGYEHEDEPEAVRMEKIETRILKQLGYPDPYSAGPHHG
ncbi:MAG TPA: rRNA maturation RNase YbeY [Burkholderiales bacterium]|nr:rRNA maturation RNase YbeY [Burkholderiales bacterium]